MPPTAIIFYRHDDGRVPVREWLQELQRSQPRAFAKCVAQIERLEHAGHELRRPAADYLRDGIYELRIKSGRVNYRILYFFHGTASVVLGHALTKEKEVPDADIERAIRRKERFEATPEAHTARP